MVRTVIRSGLAGDEDDQMETKGAKKAVAKRAGGAGGKRGGGGGGGSASMCETRAAGSRRTCARPCPRTLIFGLNTDSSSARLSTAGGRSVAQGTAASASFVSRAGSVLGNAASAAVSLPPFMIDGTSVGSQAGGNTESSTFEESLMQELLEDNLGREFRVISTMLSKLQGPGNARRISVISQPQWKQSGPC